MTILSLLLSAAATRVGGRAGGGLFAHAPGPGAPRGGGSRAVDAPRPRLGLRSAANGPAFSVSSPTRAPPRGDRSREPAQATARPARRLSRRPPPLRGAPSARTGGAAAQGCVRGG